ncbi:FKBP-type peptidyl-prolyl cis-trans isomerase [Natronobacterium gregoryi]|uniref:peptidylprolyl isomerase n=2 Tax=Natronobacterium gregoryi TaxID=44930 RepID=L0AEB1_NATGS|nr:peptidylprolyl isomerase [Natronobacterium gregoryi]AFZ71400.1 FKBP-type peptidyl-prolyl cis-trans isomerase [Natronobacterium gregoryi SP2]ELY66925.1 FKBP-type peptidylprolyl isomerase [Natronobacterium gregoryi SP2]PLK21221.1 peptidylprolyl isomerase [Natronobacterium gregoryi SP2]SFI84583.1 FKBP-type peptidyl-prolyl cis-trans isomerase SlyD [Natronobacterium gregoryi]
MTEEEEADLEAQADDVEENEDADEAATEGLQMGDFVEIEYTAYTADGDQLVDTTDPDVAEEEGVDDQGQEFKPRTIVLGEGHIFETVEDELVGGEAGDEGTVTVSAQEAFGEYNPENVETVSAEKVDEDDRYPGANVTIDGRQGYISTIVGGRARVDFNHPLAGEDVEYEYEIVDVVEDREQQAAGLFEMMLGMEPELWIETDEVEEEVPVEPDTDEEDEDDEPAEPEFETEVVEKETLYLEATPQMTMNQQWMMGKQQIGQQVIDQIGVDRVIVQEVIDGMGGMGMPGMMGGGMGGGDIEDALEDADVDADEIVEELEGDEE